MNSELMSIQPDELKSRVNIAVNKLLKNDNFLLSSNANERSISHKFAEYLQQEFPEWNVDCEYNRDLHGNIKKIDEWRSNNLEEPSADDTDAKTVYPDIIIHHRNSRNNLLVIEIKKSSNSDQGEVDIEKLKMFIEENGGLNYHYGLFINFKVDGVSDIKSLKWLPAEIFGDGDHE